MSNFEILALDPTTPQIRAPGAGDGYSVPRDMTFATGTTLNAPTTVVSVDTATDALRITQVGSGNALVVEDSANPDATPTVITATGNLGIGTTSPATNLSIIGTGIPDAGSVGAYQVSVDNNAAYNANPQGGIIHRFKWSSAGTLTTGAGIRFYKPNTNDSDASSQIGFIVRSGISAQTQAMTLDSSGNLTVANGDITIGTNGKKLYTNYIANNSGTNLNFDAANFLFNTGNLGLGVTPSAWGAGKAFDVGAGGALWSSANAQVQVLNNSYFDGTNFKYKNTAAASRYRQVDGAHEWYYAASGTAGNAITFTQAMTLNASGNLGIGTTSPAAKLDVSGTIQSTATGSAYAGYFNYVGATGQGVGISSNGVGSSYAMFFFNNGVSVGNIYLTSTTTTYATSSDRRLKSNIVPSPSASNVIDAIEIVSHGWKAAPDKRVTYGLIAQDLAKVAPEAVTVGDDGEEVKETWGVDYSKLVPMLIKEMQSLRKRVAELEAE